MSISLRKKNIKDPNQGKDYITERKEVFNRNSHTQLLKEILAEKFLYS